MLTPSCFWDKPECRLSGPPGLEERLLAEEQEALEVDSWNERWHHNHLRCAKIEKAHKKCLMECEIEISQQ